MYNMVTQYAVIHFYGEPHLSTVIVIIGTSALVSNDTFQG